MSTDFVFETLPYVAVPVFVIGFGLRYAKSQSRAGICLKQDNTSDVGFGGRKLWQAGAWILAAGHVGGLLFPMKIIQWDMKPAQLYFLEAGAFATGVVALIAWVLAAGRFVARADGRLILQVGDAVFLACFLIETLSGLVMAVVYRWASWWSALTLTPYLRSLFTAAPVPDLARGLPWMVQLHVLPAFLMLAVFPFTRSGGRIAELANRRLGSATRPISGWLQAVSKSLWRRHDPSVWLWPEEEEE